MTSFLEIVDRTRALLQERGRVTLRALRREFSLDDDAVEDLAEELVDLGVAMREGNTLVLQGDAPSMPRPAAVAPATEPAPAPSPASTPESGERRQLTVLFCDLVGSTGLSGEFDPEEWQGVIRRYQEAAAAVLEPFGGHVAQLLGDGLLVYFGYPHAHDDDAERAVRAGLGLVDALKALTDLPVPLAVRIGIHTGAVVVGQLGGGVHRETRAARRRTRPARRSSR